MTCNIQCYKCNKPAERYVYMTVLSNLNNWDINYCLDCAEREDNINVRLLIEQDRKRIKDIESEAMMTRLRKQHNEIIRDILSVTEPKSKLTELKDLLNGYYNPDKLPYHNPIIYTYEEIGCFI